MKTFDFTGFIKFEYDSFDKITLVQTDGFKIDLVNRFSEIKDNFPDIKLQVNYWLSDSECTKEKMTENFLRKLFGDLSADYEVNSYCYSSWTSGTDYDTVLSIGGHDLYNELKNKEGQFIIIEVNVLDSF